MKAKDLVLNAEYLACSAKNWESSTYLGTGYGSTRRVRVLDVIPGSWVYRDAEGTYVRGSEHSYRTSTGVLTAVLDPATGEYAGKHAIIPTASIRGLWESTWASVQENDRRSREVRDADNAAHRASLERTQDAVFRIRHLADVLGGMCVSAVRPSEAVVSVEVLERIIARLEGK